MSIKIIKAGVAATIQDGGRSGNRGIGIGSGGAMDLYAMKISNYLCGNEDDKAVIEINFPAPEILFEEDALISITGADLCASINGLAITAWRTLFVKKNSVLKFEQPITGSRAYLAVAGGWPGEKWLGSYSTHLKLKVGGIYGQPLQKNDHIPFAKPDFSFTQNKVFSWYISSNELDKIYQPTGIIRCIKGTEYELLAEEHKRNIEEQHFIISNQSDRMGYRLESQPLLLQQPIDLVSSAVDAGTVQLLPDGNCIVLMADHQTTGGYPRIASVIKSDLPKLAQAKPGQTINFNIICLEEAENNFLKMLHTLKEIKAGCELNLNKYR